MILVPVSSIESNKFGKSELLHSMDASVLYAGGEGEIN